MATADRSPRVPAWKRIGLKLKYANDTPEQQSEKANSPAQHAPQPAAAQNLKPSKKRHIDHPAPETPAKRSRPEAEYQSTRPTSRPQRPISNHAWHDPQRSSFPAPTGVFKAPNQTPKRIVFGEDDSSQPVQAQPTQPASLRKSVSFTPDTKRVDGESATNFFKLWSAGDSGAKDSASGETNEQPSTKLKEPKQTEEPKQPKEKKQKKPKKAKQEPRSTSQEESSTNETPVYIEYLQQYHTDRGDWKFNKNKQNDLFRNLFNIYRIPPLHNPAIVEYLSGLKGQARERIARDAEEVLKGIWIRENPGEDPMSLEDAAARKAAYYEALRRSQERYEGSGASRTEYADEKLKQIMEEYERGKRAEALLDELLENELFPQPLPPATAVAPSADTPMTAIPRAIRIVETTKTGKPVASDAPRKRKRKARTDISSSSSSSDSSSSSEDESSESTSTNESESQNAKSSSKSKTPVSATQKEPSPPNGFIDTKLLDAKFGKPKTYNETAPKRTVGKTDPRGFAWTHGSKADESDSD